MVLEEEEYVVNANIGLQLMRCYYELLLSETKVLYMGCVLLFQR